MAASPHTETGAFVRRFPFLLGFAGEQIARWAVAERVFAGERNAAGRMGTWR